MRKKVCVPAAAAIVAILVVAVFYRIGPAERRVIAATLINLENQVTGVLAHGNGGTDVSSPGASGNVLTSTGTNWASSPPSGGGGGIPSTGTPNPKARRWSYCASSGQTAIGGSLSCVGESIFTSNGGSPAVTGPFCAAGSCSPFPTAAPYAYSTWENTASAGYNGSLTWGTGQNIYYASKVGTSSITVTNMRIRFGLGTWTNVATIVTGDTQPTLQMASFRFSKAVPDTDWICEAANGTAEVTADSGVAVAADTPYVLEIKFNDSVPNIVYSINGSSVCTLTSDLPLSSKSLRMGAGMAGASTSGWGIFTAWHYIEADN